MTDAVVTNAGVSSNAALVRRDAGLDAALAGEPGPGPEAGPGQEGLALPAIPVSAGALIFDRGGRLLILKPTYKSGWTIPGGVMEADGETPWDACRREVREECGLEVSGGRLACMDFRRPRPGRQGGVRFLFDCGALSRTRLKAIELQPEEISEHRLAGLDEALPLLRGPIRRRVRAACAGHGLVYLEDGHRPPGMGRRSAGPSR
ncbi:MAG: NUDIX hydrolase [Streptosporangiaceae bacterium]|jgi:ADP-ribose pyrophosphatase YjhB (NUDIX family)